MGQDTNRQISLFEERQLHRFQLLKESFDGVRFKPRRPNRPLHRVSVL